jgi:hypothetical protein
VTACGLATDENSRLTIWCWAEAIVLIAMVRNCELTNTWQRSHDRIRKVVLAWWVAILIFVRPVPAQSNLPPLCNLTKRKTVYRAHLWGR